MTHSSYRMDCGVQGEDVERDRLNVTLKATVLYSPEGIPMKDRPLIRDGKLQLIHGGNWFAHYLQLEPTGNYSSIQVPVGRVTLDQMRQELYLEVVNFSDFQMDAYSGHFGGEIRLAFLCDGGKRIPVTGGSVNGTLMEAQRSFVFSAETQVESRFEGPVALCMEGIRVAGSGEA